MSEQMRLWQLDNEVQFDDEGKRNGLPLSAVGGFESSADGSVGNIPLNLSSYPSRSDPSGIGLLARDLRNRQALRQYPRQRRSPGWRNASGLDRVTVPSIHGIGPGLGNRSCQNHSRAHEEMLCVQLASKGVERYGRPAKTSGSMVPGRSHDDEPWLCSPSWLRLLPFFSIPVPFVA